MGLLWGACGRDREKRGEETLAWFRRSWNPLAWTAPKSALNPRCLVVFGRVWANAAPTSKSTYASPKIRTIVNILPFDIFKVSAISRNFNLRSPKTILWTFVMFSRTTADYGFYSSSVIYLSDRKLIKWCGIYILPSIAAVFEHHPGLFPMRTPLPFGPRFRRAEWHGKGLRSSRFSSVENHRLSFVGRTSARVWIKIQTLAFVLILLPSTESRWFSTLTDLNMLPEFFLSTLY